MYKSTAYLEFLSGIHGEGYFRSDSLFGALCWGLRLFYGEEYLTQVILKSFLEGWPLFLITSFFPYQETNEGITHFFPNPVKEPFIFRPQSMEEFYFLKYYNKRELITEKEFSDIINGEFDEISSFNEFVKLSIKYYQESETKFILKDTPHTFVNRINPAKYSKPYYLPQIEPITPYKKGGFFFCMKCESLEILEKIKAVLRFFSDVGLGGKISSGKGTFNISFKDNYLPYKEIEMEDEINCQRLITLSLTFPDSYILYTLNQSRIKWEIRRGKISANFLQLPDYRKKPILMLKEGSNFPKAPDKKFYGANQIVSENPFQVQQYGFAFTVKMCKRLSS